jgi:hypothetical protein
VNYFILQPQLIEGLLQQNDGSATCPDAIYREPTAEPNHFCCLFTVLAEQGLASQ